MIYLYDGTKEGFFTAFLLAYGDGKARLCSKQAQLALGEEAVSVSTNPARAEKAERRFLQFDRSCISDLNKMLRSGDCDRDDTAFGYFRLLSAFKRPVRQMLALREALAADECIRRVNTEIHRMHGFIRFLECESGALYAPCSPDNDIIDLLVPHFRGRFPEFPFLIHDVTRKKAAVYDGKNTFLAPLDRAEIILSADEERWQSLWKEYYKDVNIPERERLKQMRGYMPARYWKFMPELHR